MAVTSAGVARQKQQGARRQRQLTQATLWLFGATAALSLWRFWKLRNWREFADESDNISAGWLIGKGFRLYDTLFEHHMPLAYMVAHLTNVLYPPESFAKFRIAVWLFYLLAAASFVVAPIPLSVAKRALAGTAFLVLTTLLAPAWWGEMLLAENIYACSFVIFLNLFLLPKIVARGVPIAPRVLVTAGMALGLSVSGSLVTLYPLLVIIAVTVALIVWRAVSKREVLVLLLGIALVAILELCWLLRFGSLRGFFEQAIQFNLRVYIGFLAPMLGINGTSFYAVMEDALSSGVRNGVHFRESGIDTLCGLFLILTVPFLVGWARKTWGLRSGLTLVAALVILIATLKARRSDFNGGPFCMSILLLLAWVLIHPTHKSRRAVALSAVTGLACIAASALIAKRAFDFRSSFTHGTARDPRVQASIQYVRAHTSDSERVAAFPTLPIFYYATQREPAHSGTFYLPWNAAWEQRFGKRDTCAEITAAKPRFIWLERRSVWGYAFASYARCIDQFVSSNYRTVDVERYPNLYIRREQ